MTDPEAKLERKKMVGREASGRDHGQDLPCICGHQENHPLCKARTRIPLCGCEVLASGAWATENCSGCYPSAKSYTTHELDDEDRGCQLSADSSEDTSPRPILCRWLVHWFETKYHHKSKMVDGES